MGFLCVNLPTTCSASPESNTCHTVFRMVKNGVFVCVFLHAWNILRDSVCLIDYTASVAILHLLADKAFVVTVVDLL